MNSSREYIKKYFKYKTKYLNLLNKVNTLKGGRDTFVFDHKFHTFGSENENNDFPYCLIQLSNGDIAICQSTKNFVQIFDIDGNFKHNINLRNSEDIQLTYIECMRQLPNDNLIIIAKDNNRIYEFDLNGNFIRSFGSLGNSDGQFNKPSCIAILGDNRIAIGDKNCCIQIFDINLNFLNKVNLENFTDTESCLIKSITQLASGDFAICQENINSIQIFDSTGNLKYLFGSYGNLDGELNNPTNLIEMSNGNLVVCDSYNSRIQMFDNFGNWLNSFGSEGLDNNQFNLPTNIIKLQDERIAVCDSNNNRIVFLLIEQTNENEHQNLNWSDDNIINEREYEHETPDRNIFRNVTLRNRNRTNRTNELNESNDEHEMNLYFPNLSPILQSQSNDNNDNSNDNDNNDNEIEIPNSNMFRNVTRRNRRTESHSIFNSSQDIQNSNFELRGLSEITTNLFESSFGREQNNDDEKYVFLNSINLEDPNTNQSINPSAIIKIKDDIFAILDLSGCHIHLCKIFKEQTNNIDANIQVNYSLQYISKFGSTGYNDGQFKNPFGMVKLQDEKIAVTDFENNCIQIFDTSGNFINKFGSNGSANSEFNNPTFITQLKNGNIAVSDGHNCCIQIFDTSGNFINKFGSLGIENGEFEYPTGIIQLANGDILVCDTYNNRIQIFDADGNFIDKIDNTNLHNSGINQYFNPFNLIQLTNGEIAVIDKEKQCVQMFDVDGNYIDTIIDNTGLQDIRGIEEFSNGDLVICDPTYSKLKFYYKNTLNNDDTIVDTQTVLNIINYQPYLQQKSISIMYLHLCDEKIFNFKMNVETKFSKNIQTKYPDIQKTNYEQKITIFDTLHYNRDILLTYNSKPYFIFYNVISGNRDEGIDAGGLTRTVFYELSKDLMVNYFEKDSYTNLFQFKFFSKMNKDLYDIYFFIGQLFGLAIKLKQIIEINLDPILLYQLTHNLNYNTINQKLIEKIISDYNPDLFNKIPFVCYNKDFAVFNNVCMYNDNGEQIAIEDLKKETTNKIISSLETFKETTKYFVKGFRQQINIYKSKINKLPLKLLDELIAGLCKMNYSTFIAHINFIDFTDNQKNILVNIIENNICIYGEKIYLETLLLVMTGTTKIPSIGYPSTDKLRFELKEAIEPKPIDIHSCFNQFIINPKLFVEYSTNSNTEQTELFLTFSLDTLKKLSVDFSSA